MDGIIRSSVLVVRTADLTSVAQAWQLMGERLVARSDAAFPPVSGALCGHRPPFLMATVEGISVVDTHLSTEVRKSEDCSCLV